MSGLEALSFMVYKCRGSRSRHLCLHLPLSPQPCWSWHYWGGEHHQHSTRCLESNHSSQAEQSPYSAEGIIHSLNKYNNIPVPTNLHSRGRRQTTKLCSTLAFRSCDGEKRNIEGKNSLGSEGVCCSKRVMTAEWRVKEVREQDVLRFSRRMFWAEGKQMSQGKNVPHEFEKAARSLVGWGKESRARKGQGRKACWELWLYSEPLLGFLLVGWHDLTYFLKGWHWALC